MKILEELSYEIEWRVSEITVIKTNCLTSNLSEVRKRVITKYSVVAIYSLWEGYIVKSLQLYIDYINSLKIPHKDISYKIITYHIDKRYNISDKRDNFNNKVTFVNNIREFFESDIIEIQKKIETESNVNIDVLNKLLDRFDLREIGNRELKGGFHKLLKYRNSIAHGENTLDVTIDIIVELSNYIISAMDELYDSIEDGINEKRYLNRNIS